MEISASVIFAFITNYLLAVTVCFVGCFTRELYSAGKTRTKISFIRIITETITTGFIAVVIYRGIQIKALNIPFEWYMGICFSLGFWSDTFMELLNNEGIIKGFLQTIISKFGTAGKAFVEAWKTADDNNNKRKEIRRKAKEDSSKKR